MQWSRLTTAFSENYTGKPNVHVVYYVSDRALTDRQTHTHRVITITLAHALSISKTEPPVQNTVGVVLKCICIILF